MRLSSRILIVAASAVLAGVFAGLFLFVRFYLKDPQAVPLLAVVAYGAAAFALTGWVVQSWISIRNSRKQHTINVLFNTRLSPEYIQNTENIRAYFPEESEIKLKDLKEMPDRTVMESVRFLLNYYEFVAVGIRHGDLDIRLIRDCLCSQLCIFVDRCEDVIRNVRNENQFWEPAPGKTRLLRNLVWLRVKWHRFYQTKRFVPWYIRWARRIFRARRIYRH